MNKLVCSEISSFVYAQGVSDLLIEELILVQILKDSWSGGQRPFLEKIKLGEAIAKFYRMKFTYYHFNDRYEALKHLDENTMLDISVLSYLKIDRKYRNNCAVLSIAPEHVALTKPTIFNGLTPQLKRRIEFIRKVFFKYKIFSFYNLSQSKTKSMLLKERGLDLKLVLLKSQEMYNYLKLVNFNRTIPKQEFDEVIFMLPLGANFGGSSDFNTKLFNLVQDFAFENGIKTIVVKNHPSDETNYSEFLKSSESGINLLFWDATLIRMIPLELLVHCAKKFSFMGMYSTVMFTHKDFVNHASTVIIPIDTVVGSVWSDYQLGTVLTLFPHHLVSISS